MANAQAVKAKADTLKESIAAIKQALEKDTLNRNDLLEKIKAAEKALEKAAVTSDEKVRLTGALTLLEADANDKNKKRLELIGSFNSYFGSYIKLGSATKKLVPVLTPVQKDRLKTALQALEKNKEYGGGDVEYSAFAEFGKNVDLRSDDLQTRKD
ncbi:MAG: hypothetical protein PHS02_04690, partial [Candidatus ainarchaeum sp.]|nr:hypothetical protein [Candidatus ainarchaeum sp.]